MRQLIFGSLPTAAILLSPTDAFAHSAERGLVMLLPTGYYLSGAAIAVLLSFLLLTLAPEAWLWRIATARRRLLLIADKSPVGSSCIVFLGLTALICSGYIGPRDPLSNPLPLFIWTGWWVGFTLLHFVLGNLWHYLNPWTGPVRLCRRLVGNKQPPLQLPTKLGYWPAIIVFAGFAWFELVDPAPEDPSRLATAVAGYWLFVFCNMLLFGERDWRQRAEPFTIFFRLVGACSPLVRESTETEAARGGTTFYLAWPGQGLLKLPSLPGSGILFVLLTLSSVSFDGIAKTFIWLGTIGVNPLEFPGRSAVQVQNSIGLALAFVILAGLFYLVVYLGWCLLRRDRDNLRLPAWKSASGRLVYSIIPISIVFHLAHYLTLMLVNGQYLILAFGDPFNRGWQLFHGQVSTSFLSNLHSVSLIWAAQTLIITLGHVIGIVVAHMLALQIYGDRESRSKMAARSQIFLALTMVGYTVFGLWLLSTASI